MSDLRQKLLTLRDELGKSHQLGPNDRAMLETVMSDSKSASKAFRPYAVFDAMSAESVAMQRPHST